MRCWSSATEIVVMRDGAVVADETAEGMDARRARHADDRPRTAAGGTRPARFWRPRPCSPSRSCPPARCCAISILVLRRGVVTALAGQVGSGASDVLRALAGVVPDATGQVTGGGSRLKLGDPRCLDPGWHRLPVLRPQGGLFPSRSIAGDLGGDAAGRAAIGRRAFPHHRAGRRARIAARVGLDGARLGEQVVRLRGGNQQKTFLGRCLERTDIRVLLLDEPTRGVDVGGRAEIHDLLRALAAQGVVGRPCLLDLDEVLDLADDVLVMRSGRIASHLPRADTDNVRLLSDMRRIITPPDVAA